MRVPILTHLSALFQNMKVSLLDDDEEPIADHLKTIIESMLISFKFKTLFINTIKSDPIASKH